MIWIFAVILWAGILTMRVPQRWMLSGYEFAMFSMAAVLILRRRFAIALHPIGVLLAAAAGWGILQVSLGITVDAQHTMEAALHWSTNCAAFCIALAVSDQARRRGHFLTAQVIFAMAIAVGGVIGLFTVRELGPFAYYNQFAEFLEPALALAIAAAVLDRRRPILWMTIAGTLFACVVAAASRAGTMVCLGELILLPAIAFGRGWISRPVFIRGAVAGVVIAGVLVAVAGGDTIWRRLQEPHPYALRANLVRSSVSMIRERPWAGFGLSTWPDAYPAFARYDDGTFVNQAHNDWLQWAVEGGLPFFALMAAVVALLVRPAWRSLWGLGLLAVFVHALVDYPMQQRPALAAYFLALAGVLAADSGEPTSSPERRSPV